LTQCNFSEVLVLQGTGSCDGKVALGEGMSSQPGTTRRRISANLATAGIGGEVLMALADALPVAGHVKAGMARVLAITSSQRVTEYPDLPTVAEAGVPDLEVTLWSGLFAPAATPSLIISRLERQLMETIRLPEVHARLAALAVQPNGGSARDLGQRIAVEIPRWAAIAKSATISLD
jgi:tripartite-type tricarboxylate transporter receptor subunit TctC